jgi:hypothetical protein
MRQGPANLPRSDKSDLLARQVPVSLENYWMI